MRSLLAGTLPRASYIALLANLFGVYSALEDELLRNIRHPALAPIWHSELLRVPSLSRDLSALSASQWVDGFLPAEPAVRYAARIREVGASAPWRLVGHAYTRYLGDLSGGQILKRLIIPQLGATPSVAFYEFPGIPDLDQFKRQFRKSLDELPLDTSQQDAVVAESLIAFRLNGELFEALEVEQEIPR